MWARLRFYWVVAVCGGVLMALEILASRVLAPHYGNSVYVWGSIISVFLAALSLGYLWGGRLADRHPLMASLGRMVALAAAFQAVLLISGTQLAERLSELTGGRPAGTLLATAVLFGPASVLLATVSPWALRMAARDLGRLGDTAGRLFALSTLGSLAGTLACTFLLIPFLELRQILALLTGLTAATACVTLADSFRSEKPAAALSALLLALSVGGAARPSAGDPSLLYERVTPYQTLQVRADSGVRYLVSDRVQRAAVRDADGEPGLSYVRSAAAALLLQPRIERMLVLGLGGGTVGNYLQRRLPGLHVDSVDIDPAVPEVARRFLHFREGPRNTVTVDDARRFLHRSNQRWDFIFSDTYIGLSVPFHMTTIEFMREVSARLAPGGVFGVNLAAGLNDPFSLAIYRTIAESFSSVYVFAVPAGENVLVMATREPQPMTRAELVARGRQLDRRWRFDPPLAGLALGQRDLDLETLKAPLLTDDFAPVDRLIRLGGRGVGSASRGFRIPRSRRLPG